MRGPTLGLALIARDEADSLPTLLDSIEGAFDQVAFLDTGSEDNTVEIFERWAKRDGCDYVIDTFEWCDDFAAARNAAWALLDTEWVATADCDDAIRGAEHIRPLLATVPDLCSGVIVQYEVREDLRAARLDAGLATWTTLPKLWRRRTMEWAAPLHEFLYRPVPADRRAGILNPQLVAWIHQRANNRPASAARNVGITRAWAERDPTNPLAVFRLAEAEHKVGSERIAREHLWVADRLMAEWAQRRGELWPVPPGHGTPLLQRAHLEYENRQAVGRR